MNDKFEITSASDTRKNERGYLRESRRTTYMYENLTREY